MHQCYDFLSTFLWHVAVKTKDKIRIRNTLTSVYNAILINGGGGDETAPGT